MYVRKVDCAEAGPGFASGSRAKPGGLVASMEQELKTPVTVPASLSFVVNVLQSLSLRLGMGPECCSRGDDSLFYLPRLGALGAKCAGPLR